MARSLDSSGTRSVVESPVRDLVGRGRIYSVTLNRSLLSTGFQESQTLAWLSALRRRTGGRGQRTRAGRGSARLGIRQGFVSGVKRTLRGEALDLFRHRLSGKVLPRRAGNRGRVQLSQVDRIGGACRRSLPTISVFPERESQYQEFRSLSTRPLERVRSFRPTKETSGERKASGNARKASGSERTSKRLHRRRGPGRKRQGAVSRGTAWAILGSLAIPRGGEEEEVEREVEVQETPDLR